MIIRNTSDKVNAAKVIGFGKNWIMPGEEKDIPDADVLTPILDDRGNDTGKMDVIQSLKIQKKMGLIDYTYPAKKAETAAAEEPAPAALDEEETPEEEKKMTASEKRAATLAAKAAAKNAGK